MFKQETNVTGIDGAGRGANFQTPNILNQKNNITRSHE